MSTYTHSFDTPVFKGDVTLHTGLFINGQFVDPVSSESGTIEVVNPATASVITHVAAGSSQDVESAVRAATKAFKTTWGLKCPGVERGKLLFKLADLIERDIEQLAAIEAVDTGKVFEKTKAQDLGGCLSVLRHFGGWADKIQGKTIETNESKFAYTRREPYGVVGAIVPWNFPLMMTTVKLAMALAAGNTVVLKPSEFTPLSALKLADLINEAGFPPGVVNIINGYGNTVGQAISEHLDIHKVSFTGSTLTGRRVMKAAAESNLKKVSLELGGKSPTIIFDDADLDQAVKWATHGIFYNMGQVCTAGSRIFVQETIYEKFLAQFAGIAQYLGSKSGDPFAAGTEHGPQVSKVQYERIMGYIESGKAEGATVHTGGAKVGEQGYFILPTIFTDAKPEMKIVQEEIFGPVGVVVKFKDEADVIEMANNTQYGLACHIFSQTMSRALRVAHAIEAGNAWVNCANVPEMSLPFGGYKQSGIGRELGEDGLDEFTQIKSVHINIGAMI